MKDENYCFACGTENPYGLHLKFALEDETLLAKKILPCEFQGYEGIVHGGIVTTMLDEAMSKFIQEKYHEQALTGRLEVRFKNPTPTNQELKISAWQESQRRNIIFLKSTIETEDGTVTAEATAKFAVVSEQ